MCLCVYTCSRYHTHSHPYSHTHSHPYSHALPHTLPPTLPPTLSHTPIQLRISEMEVSKARNMIEHEREIFSRPARTWIPSTTNVKRKREGGEGVRSEGMKVREVKSEGVRE